MISKVVMPKQFPTYSQSSTTNFITSQDQPIISSQTSWSSPYGGQSTTVNTDEQPQQQYGQLPNQPQFTFVPQQQKLRSFARVFQPELNMKGNIQSAYRR